MTVYFDRTYLENLMGPSVVSGALSYGGHTTATTGSRFDQLVTGSCRWVDHYYKGAGYSVPLSDPVANGAADLAAMRCMAMLYSTTGQPVPETLKVEIQNGLTTLLYLVDGKVQLPSTAPDEQGFPQGGNAFTDSTDGTDYEPLVSIGKLKGTFF